MYNEMSDHQKASNGEKENSWKVYLRAFYNTTMMYS